MSWFVVFLMLLAFAMMVGPILLVQPSRRDRKVAGMRAKASQLGLRVSLQKLGEDNLAVYELPWSRTDQRPLMGVEWMLERKPYAHDIHLGLADLVASNKHDRAVPHEVPDGHEVAVAGHRR